MLQSPGPACQFHRESASTTKHTTLHLDCKDYCNRDALFIFFLAKTLNLSMLVVSPGAEFIWRDLLPLVYCCLKLYGSHKGISLTLIHHPLIFFFIFIFWCLWCVKTFMRFSRACFARLLHRTHETSCFDEQIFITFGPAPGDIHFIKALEPCIVWVPSIPA